MSVKLGIISLGCDKNRVDTENLLAYAGDAGIEFTADENDADVILINTCAFIKKSQQEAIDTILEFVEKKKERDFKIIVTGCLPERYKQEIVDAIPEVDAFLGISEYSKIADVIKSVEEGKKVVDFTPCDLPSTKRVLTTPYHYAYLKIAEGCDNHCTYCAIPKIRGPYRSRPEADILREIESLAKQGVKEHILVAQDTSRYGMDFGGGSKLAELMQKAAKIDGVDWLRVLYCYPDETDERLLDVIANTPNICKYLDLPIQHINDVILRRMHRRGTSADIRRCLRLARERDLTLRTSIIVGFPGETEEQFQELMDFLQEAEFDRLGAFAYSAEEDTPAARMPDQIPEEVKQERLDRLMTLQQGISLRRNQRRLGQIEKVLVTDRDDMGNILGRSQREAPETDGEILFTGATVPEPGQFVQVKITRAEPYDLMGEMV